MHEMNLQRFAGPVSAFGAFGAPSLRGFRMSRTTFALLALFAFVAALYVAGVLDGHGALLLAAGPTAAVSKREEALAKLLEAKGLVEADDSVKTENEERFQALMGEFRELDAQAQKAATQDDNIGSLRERMQFYTGKATGAPMRFNSTELDTNAAKTPGQQFVESEAYKGLVASGTLDSPDGHFRVSPVVVGRPIPQRFQGAATDVIQTESGGPAAGLVVPYRLPGILDLPQRPRVIRDLFPVENMPSGDTIEYAAQVGFDNAAAAVAQATTTGNGAKPQSSIAWEERTAKAQWIATWMVATRQALADANQTRSLIDNQGRLMLALEEEDQLVAGNGTPPNISGLLDQTGLQLLDLSGSSDNRNLDGIRTARRLVRTGLSRLRPTFVLVNPVDSEEFDLMQDLEGRYRAGDPFGPIGGDDSPPIWKLRRIETEALDEGVTLVGAREGATIYERQPLTVLTADQHADFFVRNLVVILFEERLAFPVYFPTAFVEVTLDEWSLGS
jgi:HK97 family phage major capsid protein